MEFIKQLGTIGIFEFSQTAVSGECIRRRDAFQVHAVGKGRSSEPVEESRERFINEKDFWDISGGIKAGDGETVARNENSDRPTPQGPRSSTKQSGLHLRSCPAGQVNPRLT